ncbi:S8 family peptidase [Streptomyces sp. NBC_01408]|uniref:S8 family peptidase n=1 Tax=Streptomyces sp. NBC_01408 TaxID=2903855 RepID=UPI0022506D12|nr:S8 family peptidase [Streptomyces sp. NBC_01408]MCX4691865.1 S8 family peptidase [Streptomyces sp. NBC_01408]
MRLVARVATAALIALAPVAAGTASSSAAAPEPTPAPLMTSANAVPGQYIVTLEKGVDAAKTAEKLGLKTSFLYTSALNGFAVPLTPLQLTIVRNSLGVKVVEEDASVQSVPRQTSPGAMRAPSNSWGQDRIDQAKLPLDNSFTPQGNGAGVTAYILDTGIDYNHTEFGGRATFGFDAVGDGRNGQDCQGHGTHVAGTVGGSTYGVAKKASLVSVRVLGCDGKGTWSGIIAGMDWVAKNAKQPAVLNGSLGGDRSTAVNDAATALSDAGVLPVIAAGNSAVDACNISPASAARVLTVAASNQWDEETSFSNYGPCVSLYAPGAAIVSSKLGGGSVALDGTSMAAPHVAGVAALYKQAHPAADPAELNEFIDSESTKDVLTSVSKGSPNQLLFLGGL